MTTFPSLANVLSNETPLPTPNIHIARIGVTNTPITFAKIALKIAVPRFPPAASVCATQMLIVQGRHASTNKPSLRV